MRRARQLRNKWTPWGVTASLIVALGLVTTVIVVSMHHKVSGGVGVVIHVQPTVSLLDQPVQVRIFHLPPKQLVSITLTSIDALGRTWVSTARFESGSQGEINLATTPSLGGSYTGVQPMGIVSSMKPMAGQSGNYAYWWAASSAQDFHLSVGISGQEVASATFQRLGSAPGVTVTAETLAAQGFIGQFWMPPPGMVRRPAILEFGGSEGGLDGGVLGADLASAGYPTLDIAYFKEPGLPQTLSRIPLEYFARALTWLSTQPGVDRQQIYVLGISRGSEAALLLGVHYPALVHGVIAAVPNDAALCSYPGCTGPAWTLNGQPLPYTTQFDNPSPTDNPQAIIPVEEIQGPIFLVCGGADRVWDSCVFADAIMSRLAAHHDPYEHVLYAYASAGHGVGMIAPYEPDQLLPALVDLTGSVPDANHLADATLWPKLLAFLADTTGTP